MSDHDQHRPPERLIPPLLRFLGLHLALGTAIGIAFVSLIILIDLAGLKKLLLETEDLFVPLLLLYSFNVITFSSVTMGIGIMTLPKGEPRHRSDTDPGRDDKPGPQPRDGRPGKSR